jgi:hypothetical protein
LCAWLRLLLVLRLRRGAATLQRAHLLFELLVLELKLLDGAGELTHRIFNAVEAHHEIAGIGLRDLTALVAAAVLDRRVTLRLLRLAAAEQVVEEPGLGAILRMRTGRQE